ncbi:MAG: ABC transporter permease [Candidatus Omnitrophica bacterium]|nr:ABC transporter permease [Candidatus Omnitrophota bacterium]
MRRRAADLWVRIGGGVIVALAVLAVAAPSAATHDPNAIDLLEALQPPSALHWLGTDSLGRDLYSRLVFGARISLLVGVGAIGVAMLIGTALGLAAGWYGGWVDSALMRFVDVMLCFPTFFLLLAIVALIGQSVANIILIIGVTGWMGVARLVRAEVLSLKEREFIQAARVLGFGAGRIMWRHLLPNALSPVLVSATLGIGSAILVESGLSFLGLGVQPPTPSWGNLLIDAKGTLGVAWWLTLYPGLAILCTVLAFNLLGEGLRERLGRS